MFCDLSKLTLVEHVQRKEESKVTCATIIGGRLLGMVNKQQVVFLSLESKPSYVRLFLMQTIIFRVLSQYEEKNGNFGIL